MIAVFILVFGIFSLVISPPAHCDDAQNPEIPPRVEYRLTAFGQKFLRLLKEVEKLQAELEKGS